MSREKKRLTLRFFANFLACVFFLGFVTAIAVHAQVAGAQLTGSVKDASGAVIPNASVTAVNTATNVSSSTTSNSSGIYSIANLNPGTYTITASAPGFSKTQTNVTLTVGATQVLNFALKVGQVQQVVTVTGAAAAVNLSTPTLEGNVSQQQIVTLPLNGRDWASLATLQPGVDQMRAQEVVTQPGGDLRGLGNQDTIDGNRATQNVYRLNGLIVNDYSNAGPGNVLGDNAGVDAIQEFSVLTTNYSAQYGYTSGGVINAVTKSGTNQWHGEGYDFLRNSYFDAPPFFDNVDHTKPGNFVRNQFGAALGGPIKHDKIFVFGNYEGIRQSQAVPARTKVLTAAAKQGIIVGQPAFTGTCPYNLVNEAPGQAAFCVDPLEYKAYTELSPLPSPGLPLIDPEVGFYAYDAKQVVSGNYETVRGDYQISSTDHMDINWYQDHSLWSRPGVATISGFTVPHNAYSLEETHVFSPSLVNTIRVGLSESKLGSPNLGIKPGSPISSSALNDTEFGILPGLTASGTGALAGEVGVVGASGIQGGFLPGTSGFARGQGLIQGYDDADKTWGNQDIKLGFMFIRNWDDFLNSNGPGNGSVSYASYVRELENIPSTIRMPNDPRVPGGELPIWHDFHANVIAGYVDDTYRMKSNFTWDLGVRYEMQTTPVETSHELPNEASIFYSMPELYTNPSACQAPTPTGCAIFRQAPIFTNNPTATNFMPRVGFAWDPFKTGKTSIRGGFGMFDILDQPWQLGLNVLQTAPSGTEIDLNCNGSNLDGPALAGGLTLQGVPINGDPLPCQGIWPKGILPLVETFGTSPPKRVNYDQPNPGLGYVLQWNVNVQRQVTPNFSITAAYLGSRGIHAPFQTDELNTVFPYKTPYGYLFPNPVGSGCFQSTDQYANSPCSGTDEQLGLPGNFSANPTAIVPGLLINPYTALIQSTVYQAQSWYRAMTISAIRKMSKGFYIQGSFTWQRSLDTSSSSFAGDNYASDATPTIPWWDLSLTKGPSDFNVGRSFVVNSLYDLPVGNSLHGPAKAIVGGWQVGGILTLSDGIGLWPLDGLEGDPMGQLNGEPLAVPQMVPGCRPTNPGSVQYFNPSCFINQEAPNLAFYNAAPPFGCDHSYAYPTCINLLGTGPATLKRNQLVGPGEFNLDMSLLKNFPISKISESFNIQFQANAFNILNHVNLQAPVDNMEPLSATGTPVPGFGQVDSTETPNRELQFALKVIF